MPHSTGCSTDGIARARFRKASTLAVAGLTLGGLLAGCGSGSQSTAAPSSGANGSVLTLSGPDRQDKLEAAARAEGQLSWYTSLAGDAYQVLAKQFNAKYPYIKVNVFRGAQNEVVTRVKQELAAGGASADAIELTSDGVKLFDEQGQLVDFFNKEGALLPADYKKDGANGTIRYGAARISYIGFGYNTTKVGPSLVPKTLDDLANPGLARQTSIASSTTGVRWIGSVLHDMGDKKGSEFLKTLAKGGMKVQALSGAALMGFVASGEVGASPTVFEDHATLQKAKGAPVEWMPVGSVVPNVGDVAILKGAKHPAAAVLMNDFLLGAEGQKALKALGYASPLDKADFAVWSPESDFPTVPEYQAAYKKWQDLLKSTFGG